MSERITLRAKSDGTEISGELHFRGRDHWFVELAPGASTNCFYEEFWDRVYDLPTKPGTVFRATVQDVPNVRVMVTGGDDSYPYLSAERHGGFYWHGAPDIDASTVVIELEGEGAGNE